MLIVITNDCVYLDIVILGLEDIILYFREGRSNFGTGQVGGSRF